MRNDRQYMTFVGRFLLAAIFIMSGLSKLNDPQGTQQYMEAMGMTSAMAFFFWSAVVIELGGGLALLLGLFTRFAATMLVLFMIPTTWIFHTNFADPNQVIHFLKNLAIMGGLLYAGVFGAGPLSVDMGMSQARHEEIGPRSGETIPGRRSA
jgi:putative oxidoreductase